MNSRNICEYLNKLILKYSWVPRFQDIISRFQLSKLK